MTAPPTQPALLWDIFCQVIDNHGDLGVCWRLACQLAARGQAVRLWVDDRSALAWMAPGAVDGQVHGIEVRTWAPGIHGAMPPAQWANLPASDVWIEAFGCEIDPEFIASQHQKTMDSSKNNLKNPVWINLEYLSAESYVERCHGLPSPVMHGPGQGLTRQFFYPGFTPRTGGLLRETDLTARQAAFDRTQWLARQSIAWHGERLVSLFCYEPAALGAFLAQLEADPHPTRLLVTHGRAGEAVKSWFSHQKGMIPASNSHQSLSISYLPALTQSDYDHLLWSCDLNFVRGEDSFVRALWAGKPFIWHIYPQDDGAHAPKLEAFLDWMQAPPSLRQFHRVWNATDPHSGTGPLPPLDLHAWQASTAQARTRLMAQDDLATQLLGFVAKKR